MSHVDEGALHAYLDGALDEYPEHEARRIRAHLERCARCAERLEEERSVRASAEEILAAPDLSEPLPSLEDLRRLARTGPDAARTRPRAVYRWGWAASVVLALGTGWMLRDAGRPAARTDSPPDAPRLAEGAARDAAPPDALAAGADERAAGSEGADAETGTVAPELAAPEIAARSPDEARPPASVRGDESGAGPGAASAQEGVAGPDEAPLRIAEAPAETVEIAPQAGAEDLAPEPASAGGMAEGYDRTGRAAAQASEPERRAREEAAQDQVRADAAGAPAPDQAGMPAPGAAPLELRSEAGGTPPALRAEGALADRARAAAARARTDSDRVRDDAEAGSLVVPGLEVVSIVWREEGVTPAGVRVLQRLDDGRALELVHLPAGIDPDTLDPPETGVRELVVPRQGGWLVMRAPVSEESLQALLRRLEQAP